MLSFLKGLAGSDVFLELPDTEKGLIQLQWMSFIGGRVNVDNFQRVCMELRMQSSLEDGEWNLLKLGLEAMVRSQGFSEVDFRFIRLTMMTKRVRSWRRVWRPTWARVTWKVLYVWWVPECAALDWEEDTVNRQELKESSSWESCWPRADPTDKMECHPKARELQKAARDRCRGQTSQSCGSTDSRSGEQILGREVKEEYNVRASRMWWNWDG